jgi:hypothetical protein
VPGKRHTRTSIFRYTETDLRQAESEGEGVTDHGPALPQLGTWAAVPYLRDGAGPPAALAPRAGVVLLWSRNVP